MKKLVLLVFCSVAVTGCSSGRWVSYSGVGATDYDIRQCKHYAAEEAKKILDENSGSAEVATAALIASAFVADNLRDRCMEENGYRWVVGDE